MVTLVINKNEGTVTVRSKDFADSYTLVSSRTQYIEDVMMYVIVATKHDNKVTIQVPVEITTKIVIEKDSSNESVGIHN